MGVAKAQLGDLVQAEKYFAQAVELDPDYEEALNNLARARRDLENLRKEP